MKVHFQFLLVSIFIIVSCNHDDAIDVKGVGAFQRLLKIEYSQPDKGFVVNDIENSSVQLDLELYSESTGKDIDRIEWYFRYRINDSISESVLDRVISSDEFELQENGLLAYNCEFTALSVLDKLGLDLLMLDVEGSFLIDAHIVMDDGTTYSAANTDNDLQGQNGFDGLFRVVVPVIYSYSLAGEYLAYSEVTTEFSLMFNECFGEIWEGEIIIEKDEDGLYLIKTKNESGIFLIDLSFGSYYACYDSQIQEQMPNGDLRIKDDFGVLSFVGGSQWGETYSFRTVEIDEDKLILEFSNDYGESARATITRVDGNWYDGLRK
ncbi:MAG: hypothetical protein ACI86M_003753 [Saprospiraceae bacterium]|jgi:hypothetical protein